MTTLNTKINTTTHDLANDLYAIATMLKAADCIDLCEHWNKLWFHISSYNKEEATKTFEALRTLFANSDPYIDGIGNIAFIVNYGTISVEVSANAGFVANVEDVVVSKTEQKFTYNGKVLKNNKMY